jgi:hypothetical protein
VRNEISSVKHQSQPFAYGSTRVLSQRADHAVESQGGELMSKTGVILASVTALLLATGYASAATMTSGRPSAVLTKSQCKAVWKEAVPSGRYLYRRDARPFIVNFSLADGPDQDGRISKREFKKACSKGLVKYRNW